MGKNPEFTLKSGEVMTGNGKSILEDYNRTNDTEGNKERRLTSIYFRPYYCFKRQDGEEGYCLFSLRNRFFRKEIKYPISLQYLADQYNKAQIEIVIKWTAKYREKQISRNEGILAIRKEIIAFHKALNKDIELYLDFVEEVRND